MTSARWERIASIVERALDLPAAERAAFVRQECGDDPELRAEVENLLATEPEEGFMEPLSLEEVDALPAGARRRIAEFELVRPLGRGGYGIVHLARDTKLDRLVALKVLSPGMALSERGVERFRREARAAARLQHPGIVKVFRADEADGIHFIAMEYVEGATLADALQAPATAPGLPLDASARPAPAAVAEIVAQVAEALDYAHGEGIVHRDVKPQNILLEGGTTPRLTDFGLAYDDTAEALTRSGELGGTFAYMSPEQALAKRVAIDHRTDVFSLGAVLYQMLTLELPFRGETSREILDRISTLDPPSPRRRNPRVPRDLEVVCLKALEKRREDRYGTAGAFAADLRRFLAHEAVEARPPSPAERLTRWARRHRPAAVALGLSPLLALLVAVLLVEARDREREGGWRSRIDAALALEEWEGAEDLVADARRAAAEARAAGALEVIVARFEARRGADAEARAKDLEARLRRAIGGEAVAGRFGSLRAPTSLGDALRTLALAGRAVLAHPDHARLAGLAAVESVFPRVRIELEPTAAFRPEAERPTASARLVDPLTETLGPPEPLGPLPVETRLPPGDWRIVVTAPDGTILGEFDRDLRPDVEPVVLRARGRERAEDVDAMRLLPATRITLDTKLGCSPVGSHVDVEAFWIDEAEVSNRDYLAFLEATGHAPPAFWRSVGYEGDWRALPGVAERGDDWLELPAVGMSLLDMRDYAEWRRKRLLTHHELEVALRGSAMLETLPDGTRANVDGPSSTGPRQAIERYAQYVRHTLPVRAEGYRQPPHGLYHMRGNVAERAWSRIAHVVDDRVDPMARAHLVMGGAWDAVADDDHMNEHATNGIDDAFAAPDHGFRCARSARVE